MMSVDPAADARVAVAARGRRPRRPARRSSSCTSAPATRSVAGRRHRLPRWPRNWRARIARRRVIVTSGPSEAAAAEAVAQQARSLAGDAAAGIVRTGEFDLAELRALVGRAALYIGGDSGPLHVAATTRTPVVALFGPTLARALDAMARSGDRRDRRRCRPAAVPPLPSTALRAGRLSLSDGNFAYDGSFSGAHVTGRARCTRTMTTLTLTAGVPPRDRLEQIGLWSLVGIVAAMQLSIAAAQILLTIAVLAWLASHIARGERLEAPPFFWPLVVYAGADAGLGRLLARSGSQLHRQQAARAVHARAADLRFRARRARQFGAEHHADHRRRQRVRRHRPVRGVQLRRPRPPPAGHAVALDDLLGHVDAGDLRARRRGCCTARPAACGPRS